MAFILFLIFHKRKIQHYRNVAWVNIAKSTHWGSKKTGNTFRWYFQMDLLEKIFIFKFRLRVCVMVQLIKSDHCSQQWLSAERATSHSPYQSGSGHTTPQCVTRPHFFFKYACISSSSYSHVPCVVLWIHAIQFRLINLSVCHPQIGVLNCWDSELFPKLLADSWWATYQYRCSMFKTVEHWLHQSRGNSVVVCV